MSGICYSDKLKDVKEEKSCLIKALLELKLIGFKLYEFQVPENSEMLMWQLYHCLGIIYSKKLALKAVTYIKRNSIDNIDSISIKIRPSREYPTQYDDYIFTINKIDSDFIFTFKILGRINGGLIDELFRIDRLFAQTEFF